MYKRQAQARVTLMNLNDGRPNHFGVFRAGVYVEEMRMLEEKVRCGWRCGWLCRFVVQFLCGAVRRGVVRYGALRLNMVRCDAV